MITRIQHQTALWRSVVCVFQPQTEEKKLTGDENVWTLKAIDQKSHDELQITCLHCTRLCVRQLSSFPSAVCVGWCTKASMFQHKKKSGGACQGWKICLTKEECKLKKNKKYRETRMEFHCWRWPRTQRFPAGLQKPTKSLIIFLQWRGLWGSFVWLI